MAQPVNVRTKPLQEFLPRPHSRPRRPQRFFHGGRVRRKKFDTIILDDVLLDASEPLLALLEARRLLKPGGRLLILLSVVTREPQEVRQLLAAPSAAV